MFIQEMIDYQTLQILPKKYYQKYKILNIVDDKKIMEVYDKYYQFDNFYISNDKKEFSKK